MEGEACQTNSNPGAMYSLGIHSVATRGNLKTWGGACVLGSVGGALSPGSQASSWRSFSHGLLCLRRYHVEGRKPKALPVASVLEKRWHELAHGPG